MSHISSATSSTLASALLNLSNSTQPAGGQTSNDPGASLNLDQLNLSGGSLSALEDQARQIASQNQSSVITTSEQAFAANLAAIASLGANFAGATASQGSPNAGTVYSLTM